MSSNSMSMNLRSLRASAEGINCANQSLRKRGLTKQALAEMLGIARSTVTNFFGSKPVDYDLFTKICEALELAWSRIADLPEDFEPEQFESEQFEIYKSRGNISDLVRDIRQKIYASVQKRYGTMRVLDMEQAVGLDSIYTRVNILEKLTRNRRRAIAELLDRYESEEFDRFVLSRVEEQRVPGLEAAARHSKLLILGKPGAGKTTFLKWVALQCIAGQFCNDLVPIFITLKTFAEAPKQPTLLDYVEQQLQECVIGDASVVETLLRSGRSLVLLDGLDEVRDVDHDRVLQEIHSLSERFDANRFIMTCRIAAQEYTFEQFTEVEVADFDQEQIADFATKWFEVKDPGKTELFLQELKANPPIRELATNPLLLTLLCLVFGEQMGFPSNRSELYKEGLDVLLKKWDAKRNIKRQEVYKQLSLQRKEDLLSQIAFTTFERGEYFFKQATLEQQITNYIRNLPNINSDPEALQLDSEAALKSIEAQHGLLVERARGIYSFSHLVFHEYFTARQIKEKRQEGALHTLVNHITEQQWREVFLLTAGMLQDADELMQLMKTQIDQLLAGDEALQQLLRQIQKTASSVDFSYKPAAIRALCFVFALDSDFIHLAMMDWSRAISRSLASIPPFHILHESTGILGTVRHLTSFLDVALPHIPPPTKRIFAHIIDPELKHHLQQLRDQVKFEQSEEELKQWLQHDSQTWIEQVQSLIGCAFQHNWKIDERQKQLLQQYYDANDLLVECLNSDCYVSREVRQEIEETLLLPMKEIEERKVKK